MIEVYGRCFGGPPMLPVTTGEVESRLEGTFSEEIGYGAGCGAVREADG